MGGLACPVSTVCLGQYGLQRRLCLSGAVLWCNSAPHRRQICATNGRYLFFLCARTLPRKMTSPCQTCDRQLPLRAPWPVRPRASAASGSRLSPYGSCAGRGSALCERLAVGARQAVAPRYANTGDVDCDNFDLAAGGKPLRAADKQSDR